MTIIITIDGNIGSGKSTIIDSLYKKYSEDKYKKRQIYFLKEPVDTWSNIKNENGRSILELFYENQEKYSFPFQMVAYISRLSSLKKILNENYDIIVCERSVYTDRYIFAKMLYNSGLMEEINYKIYTMWFDEFIKDLPPFIKIYMATDPDVAFKRIKNRDRTGEDKISFEYIETCNTMHHRWLWHEANLCLDGNHDVISNEYSNNIKKIYNYILDIKN